jgi:hypothetical protein
MKHHVFPLTYPIRAKRTGLSLIVQKIMASRLKCSFLYSSHTLTPCFQSFCMSSINGSRKTSMSMPACLGPGTVWVPHLSERIHSIGAKTKSNIPWIVREVLLMAKIEMFSLPIISKMSDLSIPLSLNMPSRS